ncbi:hypothetical protein ABT337_11855 [Saccharopolyspora hirsuta]|uniref:hypothetical protein n=1 Tax=Saccharopolyspora hirsuta TaxID=1837 RepID=UPI00332E937F
MTFKEKNPTAPGRAEVSGQIRYFQYRAGVVPEWSRFAHIRRGAIGSQIQSWCRQSFRADEVEDCAAPQIVASTLPEAVAECTDCFVQLAFRGSPDACGAEPGLVPARIDTPGQMASAMHVLQRELGDEAVRVPRGEVDPERLGKLAAEAERFSRALRRFGWLAARGR